jgi:hypothetical protein
VGVTASVKAVALQVEAVAAGNHEIGARSDFALMR